ncbi:MAG: hypothetical protein IJC88_00910 [Oscillospiraceae bacterium]|nr:hypothetical protein [Oscillospiraceae bacterium]
MIRVYLAPVRDFGATNRKNQSLTAEAIVLELLGEPLHRTENGRPVINDGFISVAHSGKTVAIAVSSAPVGMDLEEKKERSKALWMRVGAQNGYADWCKKEAYVKYLGEGFTAPPSQVELPGDVWTASMESDTLCLAVCAKTADEITVKQEVAPHVWETALLHR